MPDFTSLQRQRRFLILISLAVIAYYFLGATPNERAEYSGFGVTLANPKGVVIGLWAVWAWALWRYLQCVYERLSDLRRELREDIAAEDQRIALAQALRFGRAKAASGTFNIGNRTNVIITTVRLLGAAGDQRSPVFAMNSDGGRIYQRVEASVEFDTPEGRQHGIHQYEFRMPARAAIWVRRRSWLYAVLGLPAFSEYIAPLLVALAVPLFALFFGYADQQLRADNIDRFWRVYAETDAICFHCQQPALDVTPDLKALSAELRKNLISLRCKSGGRAGRATDC
jgi:hypothetical protein